MSYRKKFDIGAFNRRITIKNWTTIQDAGGGTSPVEVDSAEVWARVDEGSASRGMDQSQLQYQYDKKFFVRYGVAIVSDSTIDYEGQRYSIDSLEQDATGQKRFLIARATKTEVLV